MLFRARILRGGLALLAVLGLAACASAPAASAPAGGPGQAVHTEGGVYTNVSPAELAALLKNKDFLFVNVHVPYDGELDKTDAFIGYVDGDQQRVSAYPADKAAKIVLYCRSGRMSTIVAQALVKAGYTNVWNLDGGMAAWQQAGFPVLQKP